MKHWLKKKMSFLKKADELFNNRNKKNILTLNKTMEIQNKQEERNVILFTAKKFKQRK